MMTNVYVNARWVRERPTAIFDAVTLFVDWINVSADKVRPPRCRHGIDHVSRPANDPGCVASDCCRGLAA